MRARMTRMSVRGAVLALLMALAPSVHAVAAEDDPGAHLDASATSAPTPLALSPAPGRPQTPVGTASITGRVVYPAGTPTAVSTWVKVFPATVTSSEVWPVASAIAASDGSFTIPRLAGGKYKLYFATEGGRLRSEWWTNAYTAASAKVLTVTKGRSHRADVALELGASISGKVTAPAGFLGQGGTPTRVRVTSATTEWSTLGSASVQPGGRYVVEGLGPGKYKVEVVPGRSGVSGEWWKGTTEFATASVVTVAARQDRPNIDLRVQREAKISGIIRTSKGAPAVRASVSLEREVIRGGERTWTLVGVRPTDSRGRYTFDRLPAGRYRVQVSPPAGSRDRSVWYGGSTKKDATIFSARAGEPLTRIDVRLAAGGSISGTVFSGGSPVESVYVIARPTSVRGLSTGFVKSTDGRGAFRIDGLAPGTYIVEFSAPGDGRGYVSEYWKDKKTPSSAVRITVTAGKTVSGINAVIARR